jgi:hypothetical protein
MVRGRSDDRSESNETRPQDHHLRRAKARASTIVEEQRRAGEERQGERDERDGAAGIRARACFEETLIEPEVAPGRVLD